MYLICMYSVTLNTGGLVVYSSVCPFVARLPAIVLPAVHFLRVVGVAFCYICLFICFICYVLSLFNCTELPTWLLG